MTLGCVINPNKNDKGLRVVVVAVLVIIAKNPAERERNQDGLRLSHELDKIFQASRLQRIVRLPFFADG